MGMYDTFKSDNEFKCDSCKKLFKIEQGIQTKQLECELTYYEPEDVVRDFNGKMILVNEWCEHCKANVHLFLAFYEGIYIECFDTENKVLEAIDNFDIINTYKKNKIEYTNLRYRCQNMLYNLQSIYDIHTKRTTNNRLTAFLTLKNNDILDYNPIQSIRNVILKFKDI